MAKDTRRPQALRIAPLRDFLATEAAGGALLVVAAVAALAWANSPWSASYERLWHAEAAITVAGHHLALDLRHWVNDGLMTVFFLVVGLEIKRELTSGHLAGARAAAAPVAAALGGMAVPALVYLAIAGPTAGRGWGVPMATDIALALGVVALAGPRVPPAARALLLGLAVVDDIGAIVVIAVAYSSGVALGWLGGAAGAVGAVVAMRLGGVQRIWPYVVVGAGSWFALHEAGVHPTLAGVAMGLIAPSTPRWAPELIDVDELADLSGVEAARTTTELARGSVSIVEWLEHRLHPWSSYVIAPVFALANAGLEVSADGMRDALGSPVFWGVALGLVVGKPVGVLAALALARRAGATGGPGRAARGAMPGIGAAAGVGFTVALFVAELAFTDEAHRADATLAILAASAASAAVSMVLLRLAPQPGDGKQSATSRS